MTKVTKEILMQVWKDTTIAMEHAGKAQVSLWHTLCHFQYDNELNVEGFKTQTDEIQAIIIKGKRTEDGKKKARSAVSASRSIIKQALEDGRPLVRHGEVVSRGRTQLERKAVLKGMEAANTMRLSDNELKKFILNTDGTKAPPIDEQVDTTEPLGDIVARIAPMLSDEDMKTLVTDFLLSDTRIPAMAKTILEELA